jgi:hypothetical protein
MDFTPALEAVLMTTNGGLHQHKASTEPPSSSFMFAIAQLQLQLQWHQQQTETQEPRGLAHALSHAHIRN